MDKEVVVIGGIGSIWGKQFHQHSRVYEKKKLSPTIQAERLVDLTVRKWQKSELNKLQKMG